MENCCVTNDCYNVVYLECREGGENGEDQDDEEHDDDDHADVDGVAAGGGGQEPGGAGRADRSGGAGSGEQTARTVHHRLQFTVHGEVH